MLEVQCFLADPPEYHGRRSSMVLLTGSQVSTLVSVFSIQGFSGGRSLILCGIRCQHFTSSSDDPLNFGKNSLPFFEYLGYIIILFQVVNSSPISKSQ